MKSTKIKVLSALIASNVVLSITANALPFSKKIGPSEEQIMNKLGENNNKTTEQKINEKELKEKVRKAYKESNFKLEDSKKNKEIEDDNRPLEHEKKEDKVKVIVELDKKSAKDFVTKRKPIEEIAKDKRILNKVERERNAVKTKIVKLDKGNIKVKRDFSILLNGFSAEVKYADINKIKKVPGVKHVTVAKKYYPTMNYAKNITEVLNTWKDYGYKGEGLVVSIIDTGIDYTHKDMKLSNKVKPTLTRKNSYREGQKGRYYTEKVPYGYNFADDNDDVIDRTSSMHGMHVAGIVGANCQDENEIKNNKGIKGVAPEVQLLAMKVFSNDENNGGAFSDDIVAAIEDSVAHNADVINMSLGSPAAFQDPEDAEQVAIRSAVEHGTEVVVSAGNEQYSTAPFKFPDKQDNALVGSPGLAHESLQVASYENSNITTFALNYKNDKSNGKIAYFLSDVDPLEGLKGEYEIVDCNLGKEEDFKDKDVKGKIALVKRGGLTFVEKKINAQAAGAVGAVVYNNDGDETYINMATDPSIKIPCVFVKGSDGVKLKEANTKISFPGELVAVANPSKGIMSDFTSWGPTPNLDFKPEITGPGGNIWSTVNNNKYETMSGTSMSSPHVAGCMALIMQHIKSMEKDGKISFNNDKERAEFAKTIAINTAVPMIDERNKLPFSPRRQGAGMINVKNAVDNYVTVKYKDDAVVALKEVKDNKAKFNLKIHNYGDKEVIYNVKALNNKVLTDTNNALVQEMDYEDEIKDSNIKFNKNQIRIKPGKDVSLDVTVNLPNAKMDKFVEGFIRFVPETVGVPEVGIPFMGFYGDWDLVSMFDKPAWDPENLLGETTLLTQTDEGFAYVGMTDFENEVIEEHRISMSNSGEEGVINNIIPILTLFRNAKNLDVQVLNDKGEVVRNISKDVDLRKNIFLKTKTYKIQENWLWDGKIYNRFTGRMEKAKDGQYTIRVKGKCDYDNAREQVLDMDVKVDSLAPQVKIEQEIENKGNNIYNLAFSSKDRGEVKSGIRGFIVVVDGEIYIENGKALFNLNGDYRGNYDIDLKLKEKPEVIAVAAIDYAGNIGLDAVCAVEKENQEKLEIKFNNLESGMFINSDEYTIKGSVNVVPTTFTINGQNVPIKEDMTFEKTIKLEEGKLNKVKVYAKKNKTVHEFAYNVYCDIKAPIINLENPKGEGEEINITVPKDQESIVIKGNVMDDTFGYRFYINGDNVKTVELDVPDANRTKKNFEKEIKLYEGTNIISLYAEDHFGNSSMRIIVVER